MLDQLFPPTTPIIYSEGVVDDEQPLAMQTFIGIAPTKVCNCLCDGGGGGGYRGGAPDEDGRGTSASSVQAAADPETNKDDSCEQPRSACGSTYTTIEHLHVSSRRVQMQRPQSTRLKHHEYVQGPHDRAAAAASSDRSWIDQERPRLCTVHCLWAPDEAQNSLRRINAAWCRIA